MVLLQSGLYGFTAVRALGFYYLQIFLALAKSLFRPPPFGTHQHTRHSSAHTPLINIHVTHQYTRHSSTNMSLINIHATHQHTCHSSTYHSSTYTSLIKIHVTHQHTRHSSTYTSLINTHVTHQHTRHSSTYTSLINMRGKNLPPHPPRPPTCTAAVVAGRHADPPLMRVVMQCGSALEGRRGAAGRGGQGGGGGRATWGVRRGAGGGKEGGAR